MDSEAFIEKLRQLTEAHGIFWEFDCDYEPLMTGLLFYREEHSESPFVHVTGIHYDAGSRNSLAGDFDGFIRLLTDAIEEEDEL